MIWGNQSDARNRGQKNSDLEPLDLWGAHAVVIRSMDRLSTD